MPSLEASGTNAGHRRLLGQRLDVEPVALGRRREARALHRSSYWWWSIRRTVSSLEATVRSCAVALERHADPVGAVDGGAGQHRHEPEGGVDHRVARRDATRRGRVRRQAGGPRADGERVVAGPLLWSDAAATMPRARSSWTSLASAGDVEEPAGVGGARADVQRPRSTDASRAAASTMTASPTSPCGRARRGRRPPRRSRRGSTSTSAERRRGRRRRRLGAVRSPRTVDDRGDLDVERRS